MEAVSQSYHLNRRNGVWQYRRRVPLHLVQTFGKRFVQFSLGTTSLKEAMKRRSAEDLKWSLQFEAAEKAAQGMPQGSAVASVLASGQPLSEREVVQLVQRYVEDCDERARRELATDPPESDEHKAEIAANIEEEQGIVRSRSDPRADEIISRVGERILRKAGIGDEHVPWAEFAELVRRALLELDQRKLARLNDDYRHAFFDQQFDPGRKAALSFAELCDQYAQTVEEEALANGISPKWIAKQRAILVLLREIIGDATPVRDVDYNACLRVRGLLGRIPANRIKLYKDLSLDEAIARGAAQNRPLLSPVTQEVYLGTLRSLLDLAAKKRLIAINPAEGMKPVKRDTVAAGARRRPFTLEQIRQFFQGEFYRKCAAHDPPYRHDREGWMFWLPLMCLFMGMRPNEACQMATEDVRRTPQGTWYLDVVASGDEEDDGNSGQRTKTVKTSSSRRRIPIHPELMKIGFLTYVEERRRERSDRLFPSLKPDVYGNHASYPLKRFRETFLRQAITILPRQSFYSFRHNFRDALRRIDAPPDALQALGGWSQGRLTSDDYGDKSDPDYQIRYMKQVEFPGLDLSHLYAN